MCAIVIPCLTLRCLSIKSGLRGIQMRGAVKVMHALIFTKGKGVVCEKYGLHVQLFACAPESWTLQ